MRRGCANARSLLCYLRPRHHLWPWQNRQCWRQQGGEQADARRTPCGRQAWIKGQLFAACAAAKVSLRRRAAARAILRLPRRAGPPSLLLLQIAQKRANPRLLMHNLLLLRPWLDECFAMNQSCHSACDLIEVLRTACLCATVCVCFSLGVQLGPYVYCVSCHRVLPHVYAAYFESSIYISACTLKCAHSNRWHAGWQCWRAR